MINVKEIAFVSYSVTDVSRARNFYEGVLGLKAGSVFGDDTTEMAFIEYEMGPHTLAIGKGATNFVPGREGGVVALEVEDFDETVKILKENNIVFVGETMDFPSCQMATIEDPDGNRVMIHRRKSN
jgi:predicted enzyme related to lactoylglutathione lyase